MEIIGAEIGFLIAVDSIDESFVVVAPLRLG